MDKLEALRLQQPGDTIFWRKETYSGRSYPQSGPFISMSAEGEVKARDESGEIQYFLYKYVWAWTQRPADPDGVTHFVGDNPAIGRRFVEREPYPDLPPPPPFSGTPWAGLTPEQVTEARAEAVAAEARRFTIYGDRDHFGPPKKQKKERKPKSPGAPKQRRRKPRPSGT